MATAYFSRVACALNNTQDWLVDAVAPNDKHAVASVKPWLIVLTCLPMLYHTATLLEARISLFLLVNIFVRLLLPSAYYPATASRSGVLAHPLTARLIAFVAEFGLYEAWAKWAAVGFWSGSTYLWALVLFGEVTSTVGVLLQSELILNVEDTTWGLHTCYMCLLSFPHPLPVFFFGGFGLFMFGVHLPRRFRLFFGRGQALVKGSSSGLLEISPLFVGGKCAEIRRCSSEEMCWVVPMLLAQPLLTAFMFANINAR